MGRTGNLLNDPDIELSPQQHKGSTDKALLWCTAALAVIVALAYGRSLGFGFVTDDFHFARPLTSEQLLSTFYGNWEPFGQGNAHYRPLVTVSFQLDYLVWGPRPRGYHLTNLILLWVASVVGFEFLRRLLASDLIAVAVTALWVLHPLSATAASWSSERTDSIMAVWYVGALATLFRTPFRKRDALTTVVCGVLALASKEMAITLVPVALVSVHLSRVSRDGGGRRRLWALILLALFAITHVFAWRLMFPTKAHLVISGFASKVPALLVPVWLPLSYADAGSRGLGWFSVGIVSVALCIGAAIVRFADRERLRVYLLGIIWPLLTIPPMFGLRDPDIYRLGLIVCLGVSIAVGSFVNAIRKGRYGTVLAMAAVGAMAGVCLIPARETSLAWGPEGFAFQSGNVWKLKDPTWEGRLSPEMRRLFRRQARWYLRERP